MAELKENEIVISKDGKLFQLRKNDACCGCCFKGYFNCDSMLRDLFSYKYEVLQESDSECTDFIGKNRDTRLSFVEIPDGI